MLTFVKNWMLPIAMLAGVAAYFIYVNIPALNGTHAVVSRLISYVQPALLFCMLFVSFCRMSIRELKPRAWMLELLAIQVVCFVAMGLFLVWNPDSTGRVVIESGMICMICPTATAAAVVTARLHGNANVVVSYTCLINMAVSLLVPAMVPFLHASTIPGMTFETSFLLILAKVFPLLIMPLVAAWFVRHLFPRFHAYILCQTNLAFNLWAVSLSLAIGVSVKALVHSSEPPITCWASPLFPLPAVFFSLDAGVLSVVVTMSPSPALKASDRKIPSSPSGWATHSLTPSPLLLVVSIPCGTTSSTLGSFGG